MNTIRFYYHITPMENVKSIKENGLKTTDGELFLFDGADILYEFIREKRDGTFTRENHWVPIDRIIARNQLFLSNYAVFAVMLNDEEVAQLKPDLVGESTAGSQFIYNADVKASQVFLYKTVELPENFAKIWNNKYVKEAGMGAKR